MFELVLAVVTIVLLLQCLNRRKKSSHSIARIPGPPSPSYILGNLAQYFLGEVGEHEYTWQERYGAVYRIKGLFGVSRLMVSDPKVSHRNAKTNWPRPVIYRELGRFFLGRGIAWAQGIDHKRHRKILSPAFGNIKSRGMMPVFRKITDRRTIISQEAAGASAEINVADWLSRAILDTVSEAAFHYEFGSLENRDNKLARSYNSLLVDAFVAPNKAKIFAQQTLSYAPIGFFSLIEKLPSRSLKHLRATAEEGDKVAWKLVDEKLEALHNGLLPSYRDVMDIFVQANASENPSNRLSDEELYAQLRTIIAAGHKTTGNQLCFILYELAHHQDVQSKMRNKIDFMLQSVSTRGDAEYNMADLDSMKYTLAVLNKALCMHPVVYGPFVYVKKEDILPLSKPIRTTDGKMISEIPVGPRQYMHMSFAGYNRQVHDVWGDDAYDFCLERWLDGNATKAEVHFGMYHNLGNFASGTISCLGWRFATIEMQTYIVEIFRNFKISNPGSGKRVLQATSSVIAPVLEGEQGKKQLPLTVTVIG
ncbi:cytochrome P450 [Obba rivulosa]|uniref:Cytochrome P450 n=1 Tax=Obba rivulosa TaxID=1052685 RepID=A0A8E2AUM4_9APHY|nr:cytochrome P450 [Obba rivulosa]